MASSKRTGIEIEVERYSPIVSDSWLRTLSGAGRYFSVGKDRYHLGLTISVRDPIGVLWLTEPSKKVGERPIRGVLSPARFTLSSVSSADGEKVGPETEVRFVMGRPIDLLPTIDLRSDVKVAKAPESIFFDRWDFLSIEFTARHTLEDGKDKRGRPNIREVVKGIKGTDLPLARIRNEAILLAGIDGVEIVRRAGDVPKRKPVEYRRLEGDERYQVHHNVKKTPVTDDVRRQIGERFVALGGLEAQGRPGKVGPIHRQLMSEFDAIGSVGHAKTIISEARSRGLVKGLEPMSNPTKKKGKR